MIYTIYNKTTGQIERVIDCPPEMVSLQFDSVTHAALEGSFGDSSYYVEAGVPVAMPPSQRRTTSSTTPRSNGSTRARLKPRGRGSAPNATAAYKKPTGLSSPTCRWLRKKHGPPTAKRCETYLNSRAFRSTLCGHSRQRDTS